MTDTVMSALISGILTAMASIAGCWIQNQKAQAVMNVELSQLKHGLEKLEAKVGLHNGFEGRLLVQEEKMAVANHRIEDLEKKTV